MSRTRAVLASLVLLPALAAAGCGADDPEPKFAPTPTESSPAAAESSPTASAEVLGPEETVRAWVAARNRALDAGDLKPVRELTSDRCRSCDGILDPIAEVYAAGGHFDTAGWKVAAAKVETKSPERAVVSAGLVAAGGRTVPSAGASPVKYERERHIVEFRLDRTDDRWLVSFIGFLS